MQNYNISLWSSFNLMIPFNISTSVLPCCFEHPILPQRYTSPELSWHRWGRIAGIIIEKHGLQTLGLCARNVGKPVASVECIWSRRVSLQRWWTWVFETAWVGSSLFGLTTCPKRLQNQRSRLLLISFGEKVLGESHCARQLNMSFSIPSGRNIRVSQQLGIKKTTRWKTLRWLRLRLEFGLNRGLIPEVGQGDLLSRACVHGLNVENEAKSIVEQLVMIHRIGSLEALLYGFPFPSYFEQGAQDHAPIGRLSEI